MPCSTQGLTGPLKDPRIERFCQEIVRGTSVRKAMIKSGYSPHSADTNGRKILKRGYVMRRLEEIRVSGVTVAEDAPPPEFKPTGRPRDPEPSFEEIDLDDITPEWALKEALVCYHVARNQSIVASMVKLLELIIKLKSIDKMMGKKKNREPNKGDVTDHDKAKPENPIDFAALVAGLSGDRSEPGDESEGADDSDSADVGSSETL